MARRERDWVRWLREKAPGVEGLRLGVGDDAAVLDPGPRGPLVFASDQTLGRVHFEPGQEAWPLVGRKALARVLSDMAAMAARPWAAVVSLAVPRDTPDAVVEALLGGLFEHAREEGCAVAGGDMATSPGEVVVDVAGLGLLEGRAAWTRGGARAGDLLYVSGELGGSRAGHHLRFRPRWREALALHATGAVHAALDLSDGLAQDLPRMCEASGVGVRVRADALPRRVGPDGRPCSLESALGDGEDFELLLAVDPAAAASLEAAGEARGLRLTRIGEFEDGASTLIAEDGREESFPSGGYEHF